MKVFGRMVIPTITDVCPECIWNSRGAHDGVWIDNLMYIGEGAEQVRCS